VAPVDVLILHAPPPAGAGPLTALLAEARERLAAVHAQTFLQAGAKRVRIVAETLDGTPFGERLARLVRDERIERLVVLGSGAVPLLRLADAAALVDTARGGGRVALANNRYSADVVAIGDATPLRDLSPLAGDNALPRWLAESAGFTVRELGARGRLGLDLDSPLDLALVSLARGAPGVLRALARNAGLEVPRLAELHAVLSDPRAELLVAGRTSAATLAWLERRAACRVRALVEERGLRAASPDQRPPASTLGLLLDHDGPEALARIVGRLADGALVDSRVLLAHRLGADEAASPPPEDRFASDLLRPEPIADPWLRALTASAAASARPILLGGHTLVGPGVRLLLGDRPAG